jgi:hypothetical protein
MLNKIESGVSLTTLFHGITDNPLALRERFPHSGVTTYKRKVIKAATI